MNEIKKIEIVNTNEAWSSNESIKRLGHDKFIDNIMHREYGGWYDNVIKDNLVTLPYVDIIYFDTFHILYGYSLNKPQSYLTYKEAKKACKDAENEYTKLKALVCPYVSSDYGHTYHEDGNILVFDDFNKGFNIFKDKCKGKNIFMSVYYRDRKYNGDGSIGMNMYREYVHGDHESCLKFEFKFGEIG